MSLHAKMPWQGAFEFVAELPLLALEKPEESCTACLRAFATDLSASKLGTSMSKELPLQQPLSHRQPYKKSLSSIRLLANTIAPMGVL